MMEDINKEIEKHLKALCATLKGKVFAAESPEEVEDKFSFSENTWGVLVCWEGYAPFEDEPLMNMGLKWANFIFIVEKALTFKLPQGSDIKGLSGLVDKVIEWMRGLQLTDESDNGSYGFELVDTEWLISRDEKDMFRRHRIRMRTGPVMTGRTEAVAATVA